MESEDDNNYNNDTVSIQPAQYSTSDVTNGTVPIHNNTIEVENIPSVSQCSPAIPSTSFAMFSSRLGSQVPEDDTVSIRTYTSTPPPFPDDGKLNKLYLCIW